MSVDKNLELDIYDREILKCLIANKDKWLSVNKISKSTGFSWITVEEHLAKLQELGLLEVEDYGKWRKFKEKKENS